MKLSMKFMLIFLVVSLVASMVLASYSSYTYNKISEGRIHKHLEDIVKIRTNHIETFLEGEKKRVIDFSSDGFIKNNLMKLKDNPSKELMQTLSEHLINNKIIVDESIYEIDVLNNEGKVVGTTNPDEETGEDFSKDLIFLEGKKAPYVKDIFYDEEFKRDGITLSAPVSNEEEFLGVIIIKITFDELGEIVVSAGKFSQYEELYILDKNSFMITPSKFLKGENKGILTQKVDTENAKNCLDTISVNNEKENTQIDHFLNYRGEEVVGIYNHIPDTSWCLLIEIEVEGGLEIPQKEFLKSQIIISIFVITLLTLFGFFAGKNLDKKFLLKEKRGK